MLLLHVTINPIPPDRPNVTVDYKDVAVGQVGIITCIGHGQPAVNLTLCRETEEVYNVTTHA